MDGFEYRGGELYAEDVPVAAIAEAAGTPTYVYSASAIRSAFESLHRAFAPLRATPHYAVKASANLHLLRLIRGLGAGMDVVSGGELERAWLAGTPMAEVVFAGVGKTDAEIRAALDGRFSPLADEAERLCGRRTEGRGPVGMFNVESRSELERLAAIAGELGVPARVCIRVNPDVDPRTHEYTTTGLDVNKFGIDADLVPALFDAFAGRPRLELAGLHVHIGSPVREVEPYVAAVRVLLGLIETLEAAGHRISALDLGGGWPVDYQAGEAPPIEAYAEALVPLLAARVAGGLEVTLEPGRSIVANAGLLVTRVHHVKHGRRKRFVVCDAGMHTLIRPALYRAFHFVWPARVAPRHLPPVRAARLDLPDLVPCDVVGPVCESADFLARDRELPEVERGDLLAVFSAGAYGMSMTSNYNDHPRPAEVLVDGGEAVVINRRQPPAALLETELDPRLLAFEAPLEKAVQPKNR
jgi:diaminopimelate decarboxylase